MEQENELKSNAENKIREYEETYGQLVDQIQRLQKDLNMATGQATQLEGAILALRSLLGESPPEKEEENS